MWERTFLEESLPGGWGDLAGIDTDAMNLLKPWVDIISHVISNIVKSSLYYTLNQIYEIMLKYNYKTTTKI